MSEAAQPMAGWCEQEVAEELPQLRLAVSEAQIARSSLARSPRPIKERLRLLANGFNGARAINLRGEPIPAAYRVFFRHIGLDPDVVPTPIEQAVRFRIMKGGIASQGLVDDVLLIALLDTGVAVWAVDPSSLDGPLGIRLSREGEPLGRSSEAFQISAGRLVIADSSHAIALLFGELAPGHRVERGCAQATLFAIAVAGVPWLHVEEALWTAQTLLEQP
jgi:DNA/RNA-binding domain of Phe-tRNA-synthetase-like protein